MSQLLTIRRVSDGSVDCSRMGRAQVAGHGATAVAEPDRHVHSRCSRTRPGSDSRCSHVRHAPGRTCQERSDSPAKRHATGVLPESPEMLAVRPRTRTFRAFLPERVDLSDRSPVPRHQGAQGSCVGWAVGYAARSYYNSVPQMEIRGLSLPRPRPITGVFVVVGRDGIPNRGIARTTPRATPTPGNGSGWIPTAGTTRTKSVAPPRVPTRWSPPTRARRSSWRRASSHSCRGLLQGDSSAQVIGTNRNGRMESQP